MKLEKEYLLKIIDEESDADFLIDNLTKSTEFKYLGGLAKSIKNQLNVAIKIEKVLDGSMVFLDEEDEEVDIKLTYFGVFIRGQISQQKLIDMLSFFGVNNNPKADEVNIGTLIYYNKNHKIFVSDYENLKSVSILYKKETREEILSIASQYFDSINEKLDMSEDDVLKLSYDLDKLNNSNKKDFYTNLKFIDIQESLTLNFKNNPLDTIFTLSLVYRLRNLGWDKDFIYYASESGKSFNLLNSLVNIKLDKFKIEYLIENNYLDTNLDLTKIGRVTLLLINYFTPPNTNNLSNLFAPISYYLKNIPSENFVAISHQLTNLYGIKDEFFVHEKCLGGVSKNAFVDDLKYNGFIDNVINNLQKAVEIGYAPNFQINSTLDFEVCQKLFNTFNDDVLDAIGGLIMIKTYKSSEPVFVNSLIYRLIKNKYSQVTPYVSLNNSEYIVIKENDNDTIVAIIRTKKFSCQKNVVGLEDNNALISNIKNNHNSKYYSGIDINSNYPLTMGVGYIEKTELSKDDYEKIKNTPFNVLRTTIRQVNKDSYYNELIESDVLQKIISQRKTEYDEYVNGIKEIMNEKLSVLKMIYNHFVEIGNQEKQDYYRVVMDNYSNKIDKFVI